MAVAKRDDNGSPTFIGASSADGTTPIRALADPVTGYILMSIKPVTYTPTGKDKKIDDNDVRVVCAVTNDASQTVKPLLADPNNSGYVLTDVVLL